MYRDLRRSLRSMTCVTIYSGGQTGVDRAALDFSVARNWEYGGWCPRGGWAEDFPDPPGLFAAYPQMRETPSAEPQQRTAWNVRDSHATLIIVRGDDLGRSPGTEFTRQMAELVFQRPLVVVDLESAGAAPRAIDWLCGLAVAGEQDELLLNVAGPRESESPGIHILAMGFLRKLFAKNDGGVIAPSTPD